MARGTMKLIDERTGQMECTVCGATHYAMIKPESGGKYWRESWKCRFGCEKEMGI
jgi:hypothetical protein